ncbi:hypothetical protein P9112_006088 [Eukaryota sp. TZLM1-RC]
MQVAIFLLSLCILALAESITDINPIHITTLDPNSDVTTQWSSRCYENTLTIRSYPRMRMLRLTVNSERTDSFFCTDWYFLSSHTSFRTRYNALPGRSTWTLLYTTPQWNDIQAHGLHLFHIDRSAIDYLSNVLSTIQLFFSDASSETIAKFLTSKLNVEFVPRDDDLKYHIDKTLIKPGDLFIQASTSPGSALISYGTGAFVSHTVVAVEIEGEIYMAESVDDHPFADPSYHPKGSRRGFVALPFDEWYEKEQKLNGVTLHIPLREELSLKFNNKKAVEWFKEHEHTPYGYHSFLYSWWDTPNDNFPDQWSGQFFYHLLIIAEKIYPDIVYKSIVKGAQHRLGNYEVKSVSELGSLLAETGLHSFSELMSIPESVEWRYSNNQGKPDRYDYVCSAFVAKIWQLGGLFGDLSISPAEFTPIDLVQLDFFKDKWEGKPPYCGHGTSPVCQIIGSFQYPWPLLHFSKIQPYVNMNERCPRWRHYSLLC